MNNLKYDKNGLKYILYLALSFAAVFAAFSLGAIAGTIIIIASLLVLAFILRGDILSIIARYVYNEDHGKGFLWYERALKTGKMRPINILVYAYLLIRDGVLDKSEQLITKTLFIDREKLSDEYVSGAHINLSIIKWKRGDLAEAIREIEEVYESGYRSTVMYGTLGSYYILNGQLTKALEFNKEAIEFNSSDKVIRDNLAYNYYLCGNINTAADMYELLMEEEPAFIEPYYNYGLVLEDMGMYEEAMENYRKALDTEVKFLSTVSHDQVSLAIDKLSKKLCVEKGGEEQ